MGSRETLLAEIDAAILDVGRASPAIAAYRTVVSRLKDGIPLALSQKGLLPKDRKALQREEEWLEDVLPVLRLDIGYVEFHAATCRYKILRTFENLTAFRKRAAKLPKRCF